MKLHFQYFLFEVDIFGTSKQSTQYTQAFLGRKLSNLLQMKCGTNNFRFFLKKTSFSILKVSFLGFSKGFPRNYWFPLFSTIGLQNWHKEGHPRQFFAIQWLENRVSLKMHKKILTTLYQIYPSCMHSWLWPNRESNVPQRNNVHVHPNTANMCHNMDRHTSKFVYDKRTQDISVISKCYDFRFECTISTSDRALMDKTYIVTPTTTAGPEIFQFLSTDLLDPKFFA